MRIGFVITGDFRLNSRATRQVHALATANSALSLHILHIPSTSADGASILLPDNVTVREIPAPTSPAGPRRFAEIHLRAKKTLDTLSTPVDVIHASDLFVLPAAAGFAKQLKIPVTFDSRELYTHVAATVRRPWVRLAWHAVQRRFLPLACRCFTVSDGIANHLAESYDIERPIVIPNVPATRAETAGPDVRTSLGLPDNVFLALHLGQIRSDRGCEVAVQALGLAEGVHLAFVGSGPLADPLKELARRHGVAGRVHFVPAVPPDQVPTFARSADAGLTLLDDSCLNHRLALPNKLFEYIAAGVPVIGSNLPEMRTVIMDHAVGLCVEPRDPKSIAVALLKMSHEPELQSGFAANCRSARKQLTWNTYKPRFVNSLLECRKS